MLLGRGSETQTLNRLVAGARLGEAAALVVLGEPGVGKTALLEDAVAGLSEGFRVLRATGVETEQEIAFSGLSQLLAPTPEVLDQIPPPQAAALAGALALRSGVPTDRFAIGAATLSVLSLYAEQGPVALVVDDGHLLDRPTLEALAFTARRLQADPVLILVAARHFELGDALSGLPALTLSGLAPDPARALLAETSGGPVTDDEFAELYRRTEGNPLALREFGTDPTTITPELPGLPERASGVVTRAFARRLRLLGESAREVLLVVTVAGGELRLAGLACRELGLDLSLLADAEDAGLVATGEGQGAVPSPLDESRGLLRRERGATPPSAPGRRGCAPRERRDSPGLAPGGRGVGSGCGGGGPPRGAGDEAFGRSGYAVAATAYHRSATLTPAAPERCVRLLRGAEAAWAAGEPSRVTTMLDALADLDPAGELAAGALELRAAVAARTGQLREARDMLMAAADHESSPDRAVVLLADAVHAAFYLGDTATSLALADRLADLIARVTTLRARALGLMATGIALVVAGRGGAEEIRAAVPHLESSDELRADPRRLPWLMLAPLVPARERRR